MVEPIRIAVVDDHPLFRGGVVATLAWESAFELVAEGMSAAEAVAISARLKPNILLLDISLPGCGLAAARQIASATPAVKVVMLTASESEEHVMAAFEAGARGYILKGIGASDLVRTLKDIVHGETYVTPSLAARLLRHARQPIAAPQAPGAAQLTAREEQILDQVANGSTNKEIANRLKISEKTVKHYMTNIMEKLQVRNRVEAALKIRSERERLTPVAPARDHAPLGADATRTQAR